jgi:hypothetical protein
MIFILFSWSLIMGVAVAVGGNTDMAKTAGVVGIAFWSIGWLVMNNMTGPKEVSE